VYEDSSIQYPSNPALNTGGCPYRSATYRPSYMKSLNPSVECAPARAWHTASARGVHARLLGGGIEATTSTRPITEELRSRDMTAYHMVLFLADSLPFSNMQSAVYTKPKQSAMRPSQSGLYDMQCASAQPVVATQPAAYQVLRSLLSCLHMYMRPERWGGDCNLSTWAGTGLRPDVTRNARGAQLLPVLQRHADVPGRRQLDRPQRRQHRHDAAVRLLLAGAAALVGVPRVQLRPRHARHRQRHDRSLARGEPAALSGAARRMMLLGTLALGALSGHARKVVSQPPGAL
jgi:hypothetical protein